MNDVEKSNAAGGRLAELDGLRAVAILLVLFYHSSEAVPVRWISQLAATGWVGVDLFFVLSGFLIGGLLLDQRTATNYYAVFYVRRFFRIVPLYALIVLPGLLVLGLGWQKGLAGHSVAGLTLGNVWFYPFFLQNFATSLAVILPKYLIPTWSVAVEEQFYLLLPLFIRLVDPKFLLKILALAIVAAPLLRGALLLAFGGAAGVPCYVLLPCRWDSLLLGVTGAVFFRQAGFRPWFDRRIFWLRSYWWLSAAGSAGLLFNEARFTDPKMAFLGYTLIDSFFACTLLLAVMNHGGCLHRWLRWPAFKPIATTSYGLYLIHSPMLAVVESLFRLARISYPSTGWTATGVEGLSLTATAVAAAVSWKCLESRLIRMGHGHRFQPSATGHPLMPGRESFAQTPN